MMNFTLIYWDTTLKAASRSEKRSWEKGNIRTALSEQLKNLWAFNPAMREFDKNGDIQNALGKAYTRDGIEFVPLATEDLGLVCELDIVFLRAGKPGRIVSDGGDIDNRLKVLLDALRVPSAEEISFKAGESRPQRIYCLMANDDLITSLKVTTDQLLVQETVQQSEACISIHITLKAVGPFAPYEFK